MRAIRLFVDQPLSALQEINLTEETLHYALNVLRLNKNSTLSIFNGDGNEYTCEILNLNKKELEVRITAQKIVVTESTLTIDLYLAISKSSHMDYAIQKTVEAGVANIYPILTERSVTKLSDKSINNKNNHWKKIITSACEQCGRTIVPKLHSIQNLTEISQLNSNEFGFLLDANAKQSFKNFSDRNFDSVKFIIGAEGGLSTAEIKLMEVKAYQGITLGPRILRTETAALSAVVCAQLLWGDLAK